MLLIIHGKKLGGWGGGGNQCVLERTHPVILTLLEVAANSGETIATFADLESDTNYITHGATRRLARP